MVLLIGIDDTDSRQGRCTTHLAYRIVDFLLSNGYEVEEYPFLARLNPNIPWKTRGNGAVCIKVKVDMESREGEHVMQVVKEMVESNSMIGYGANPGIVFLGRCKNIEPIVRFANDALWRVMSKRGAIKVIEECKNDSSIEYYTMGNGQGMVGALASIGLASSMLDDYTFEAIAYRREEMYGLPRLVDEASVIMMDKATYPYTFNNYDYKHARVLIIPHGPDPVLLGVRGDDPCILLDALPMLNLHEPIEGYMLFRSNQGTNAHLANMLDASSLKAYTSGYVQGRVASEPLAIEGGHTFFALECYGNGGDGYGNGKGNVLCAVYEPTGLSPIAQMLSVGDLLEVGGGVRKGTSKHPKVLNVEYIKIVDLARKVRYMNPLCICGKRLKSEGKGKGYGCKKCGYRVRDAEKVEVEVPRDLRLGLYLPDAKAHRHLTKPLHRYSIKPGRVRMDIDWFKSKITD
ncbi:MAG: tRNA(Ile)(2)-agmatinylcytidine synthase [Candidatus Nitrosocaldus sp.]